MMDDTFEILRQNIDIDIDAESTGRLGIAMSVNLAGEFLKRNLIETIQFTLLFEWEAKKYRDRYVYIDPYMNDFEYRMGS